MNRLLILLFFLLPALGFSQEEKPKNWQLNGYIKNMQTLIFFNDTAGVFVQDNLIHNRLNFRWYLSEQFTFRAELRTRVFFGDLVRANPDYAKLVDNVNNDFFDLSLVLLDDNSWVIHSMLDRLYLEYVKNNLEVRVGRQRINWGINTVWNPNDIFNAFSFTDFDYEERPGSDAVRIKYYTGIASSFEVAARIYNVFEKDSLNQEKIIAGLWKINKWNYDFQVLAGYVKDDLVLGGGWAGNIKTASFKGEFSYFHALDERRKDAFAATFGVDYSIHSAQFCW